MVDERILGRRFEVCRESMEELPDRVPAPSDTRCAYGAFPADVICRRGRLALAEEEQGRWARGLRAHWRAVGGLERCAGAGGARRMGRLEGRDGRALPCI